MRKVLIFAAAVIMAASFQSGARAADTLTQQRLATVNSLMTCFENDVTQENLGKLYTDDIRFVDPMTSAMHIEITDLASLTDYFSSMKGFLLNYSFAIAHIATEDNPTDNSTFIVLYRHKNQFPLTKRIITDFVEYDCATVYKFHPGETKCYYHQDYYDQTVVYRVIPGMKFLMKIIDRQTRRILGL